MGYTVQLQLGSWSTTIDQDVPQSATDAVVVLDQLRVGWRLAGDEHPAPLEPLQAFLSLMALDVADLVALAVDDVAILRVLNTGDDVVASLYGRVTEVTATQAYRSVKGADGISVSGVWSTFSVNLVDHRAGVGVPVTMTLPLQSSASRMYALSRPGSGETGSPWPIRNPRAVEGFQPAVYDGTSLLDILDGAQRQMLANVGGTGSGTQLPGGLYQLAPIADAVTGELELLSWHRVDYAVSTAELPLTLGVVDSQLQLVPVAGADRAIPAAQVAMDGQYRRGPENRANVVRVYEYDPAQAPAGDSPLSVMVYADTYSPGDRVYLRTVIVDQLQWTTEHSTWLGQALLPPGVRVGGWDREAFVWTPGGIDDVVGMFPDWSDVSYPNTSEDTGSFGSDPDDPAAPCFTAPVAVHGIPDNANFAGAAGVYAGVLSAAELDISGGDVAVTFSLRRQLSRPNTTADPSSVLDYTTLRTRTTTAYRTGAVVVDPGLTHAELRLVRK